MTLIPFKKLIKTKKSKSRPDPAMVEKFKKFYLTVGKAAKANQETNENDGFLKAVNEIRRRDNCSRLQALEKARRERPAAFASWQAGNVQQKELPSEEIIGKLADHVRRNTQCSPYDAEQAVRAAIREGTVTKLIGASGLAQLNKEFMSKRVSGNENAFVKAMTQYINQGMPKTQAMERARLENPEAFRHWNAI